ncbi:hypothetical protein IKG41_01695 [Candidatus Saccharibacteria bacterium]|nr:hypothetical protein [Candidatus Saccharibacteria bacterium]
MKRIHKRILGLCGLALVVAVTIFAAFLPTPETQAISTSVTDTIVVRVIGTKPNIYFTSPGNDYDFLDPNQSFTYNYEHIKEAEFILEYIDEEGHVHTYPLGTRTIPEAEQDQGTGTLNINFEDYGNNYGDYNVKIIGTGVDGDAYENVIAITYWPITGTVEEIEDTGDADVSLDYLANNDEITEIIINVYDENHNLIDVLSPIKVRVPSRKAVIPFSDTNLPKGNYIITITGIGNDGQPLHEPYPMNYYYEPIEVPSTDVPDTGSFFATTNISENDYLITGLLVFGIVGICGIFFIAKDKHKR